jgi:hypothetical protein
MFHAPIATGDGDTPSPIRLRVLTRRDAVELSRLCVARPDLCRVALRLWRSFVFSVLARERGYRWAVSYQDAALRSGNLYRFDGWVRIGRSRSGVDPRTGRKGRNKAIWGWPARPCQPADASACTVAAQPTSVSVTGSGADGPFGIGG